MSIPSAQIPLFAASRHFFLCCEQEIFEPFKVAATEGTVQETEIAVADGSAESTELSVAEGAAGEAVVSDHSENGGSLKEGTDGVSGEQPVLIKYDTIPGFDHGREAAY